MHLRANNVGRWKRRLVEFDTDTGNLVERGPEKGGSHRLAWKDK